ncbi:MAG: hypothetical protein WBV82_17530 [Myxococcaceae bacterium]
MRVRLLLAAAAVVGAIGLGGCGSTVCDRNETFDPSSKAGDCSAPLPSRVLGTKNACSSALSSCSDADKTALDELLGCWENLPVCSQADQANWQSQSDACYAKVANLSEACKAAFFGGTLPGTDGGSDELDGGVDAGIQPDTTDAGALDLIAVADGERVALAWTASQPGPVAKWQVNGFSAADIPTDPAFVSPPTTMTWGTTVGAGTTMKYFVVGMNGEDQLVTGVPDAGVPDAGMMGDGGMTCTSNFECPINGICDISTGACEQLSCATDPNVCPVNYGCGLTSQVCERQAIGADGGIDAGTEEEQVVEVPRPFVSELVEVTTGPAAFSAERFISVFAAKNIDGVAIDSARQFAVMEQEGQIYGHVTQNRGNSYRISPLDPSGSRPRAAYEPQSGTVFLCYNALGGVRVRASTDNGRTFPGALDLKNEPVEEGGSVVPIQDCDIAPWQNGTALVTAIEGDAVKLWTVKKDLTVQGEVETVFTSSANWFAPKSLAIATLPSDFLVHVVFSTSRQTASAPDTEIIGMYRDTSTSGAFVGPKSVSGPLQPNPFPQREPAVVIDPVSKRPVAAFVSQESNTGGQWKDTVYVAFWVPAAKGWATGGDLNVFVQDQFNAYMVVKERMLGEQWLARSPSLTATAQGKVFLSFMAGQETGGTADMHPWVVEFGVDADNAKLGKGQKGWFVPPAVNATPETGTRVARMSGDDYAGPIVVTDQQISHYLFFVEGVGNGGVTPNRPVVISRPK